MTKAGRAFNRALKRCVQQFFDGQPMSLYFWDAFGMSKAEAEARSETLHRVAVPALRTGTEEIYEWLKAHGDCALWLGDYPVILHVGFTRAEDAMAFKLRYGRE